MGGDRVERATARRLAHLIKSSNPNAPAVKPRGRGGCPGGGGLEGRGRSRAGGLRSADRRGGTGRGGLAGALPPTIGPVQGPEADRRGRSVPDRRQSERPQKCRGYACVRWAKRYCGSSRTTSRVRIRCTGPGKDLRRRGENRHAQGHVEHAREVESRRGPAVRSHRPAAQLHLK
jgi:hypothetical protein